MPHANQVDSELARGWLLLATATLGCGMGASSLVYYSFGMFVVPLQQAFHWSRGEVTSTLFYASFGLVFAAPIVGTLIDRTSARAVALGAIPCCVAALYGLSRFSGHLVAFYAMFFLCTVVGTGTTPILYTRAVTGFFSQQRGLALGITLAGPGTAAMVLPPFMAATIATHDWRHGFEMLALFAATAFIPVLLWLIPPPPRTPEVRAVLAGMRPSHALKTRAFWTIALGFAAVSIGGSGLIVHLVPLLRDAGMDVAHAARIAALIGLGVILGRLGIGWVIDHLFAPFVAASIFAVTAGGCALLAYRGLDVAPLAAFLIGFSLGAEVDVLAYLTARYFGLRHYGFLYATLYAFFWIGAALGPAIAGELYDHFGNYQLALRVIVGALLLGAIATASLPRFSPPDAPR